MKKNSLHVSLLVSGSRVKGQTMKNVRCPVYSLSSDQSGIEGHKIDQSNFEDPKLTNQNSRVIKLINQISIVGVLGFRGSTSKEQNPLNISFLRISEHAGLVSYTFSFILKKVTMDSRVPENGTRKPSLKFHFCTLLNTLTWLDIQ